MMEGGAEMNPDGPWCASALICQETATDPVTLVRTIRGVYSKITISAGSETERNPGHSFACSAWKCHAEMSLRARRFEKRVIY